MPRTINHPALPVLKEYFSDIKFLVGEFRDMVTVVVPRENIVGTPVIIYWSFEAPTADLTNPNIGLDHIVDVVTHFFTKTRWSRTFKLTRGYPLQ